ncbi:hypothetical protein F5Y14DRAFT_429919 [Nemania sp. NC0429]|nr:hypothetical protein F5Y14DRAFT_429919 [Nemania sp. NC0429]
MDPLTAVSLAAAVVQFTDYGVRLLTDTLRVYKSASGIVPEVVELKTVVDDMRQLSQSIREKSDQLASTRTRTHNSKQKLLQLCRRCQELSDELADIVGRLQTRGTKSLNLAIESFVVAIRKVQSEDSIKTLRHKISEVREQIMMVMMVILWEESSQGADDRDQLSRRQTDMINTLARIDDATSNLNQTLLKFMQRPIERDPKGAQSQEHDLDTNNDAISSEAVLDSLLFDDLGHREEAIAKAYEETFMWLFNSPKIDEDGHPLWSDFTGWLTKPDNNKIYWITGKPGSGKSTLMKYIMNHSRLQQLLSQWAEPKPFLLAKFYFWSAGTPMQKTQEALLRTLLHQCLTKRPELIPHVCPRRWALFKVFGRAAIAEAPAWAWEELHESFSTFDLLVGEQFNLALFIDGLDEFDGNHQNLVDFVQLFHSRPGRKVCVSSRPWNVFQDAFSTNPSLRLENLTGGDIRSYVQGRLESSPAFMEYKAALPQQSNDLIKTILTKAQGVFLWVSVVVLDILEGLRDGDSWNDLCDMVDLLPDDLSHLYQRIWSNIKPRYIHQASHLFQIHRAYEGSISAKTLWLADEVNPPPLDVDLDSVQQQELIQQVMVRKLSSRTRGLLEISGNGHVEYLHRSVRDWIELIWDDIVTKSAPGFEPNLSIIRALMPRDTLGTGFGFQSNWAKFWKGVQQHFRYAVRVCDIASYTPSLIATLDQLDASLYTQSKLDEEHHQIIYDSIYFGSKGVKQTTTYKVEKLPHWSTTERRGFPENTFIGLAAQFCVSEYVRAKVTDNPKPKLLQHGPDEVSILANAVLGPEFFLGQSFKDKQEFLKGNSHRRFLLIKFLLSHDVAKSAATVPGSADVSLYHKALTRPVEMPPITMPDGAELDYWETVAALLEEHGLSRIGFLDTKIKPRLRKLFQ